jgi:hypothetical protein
MKNFERGLDPKKAMDIGFKTVFKKAGLKLNHTLIDEWAVFLHNKDNNAGLGIFAKDWTSKELRLIADYMDNYPDEMITENKET